MKTYTTKSCFKDMRYRDSDIDNLLPEEMPVISDGVISIYKTKMNETFIDMFKSNGLSTEPSVIPHCFSLQTIDKLCKDNDSRLIKDNCNFFPVTDGNKVFVLYVDWDDSRWYVGVYGFGYDYEWYADSQLFLRNLTLRNSDTLSLDDSILKHAIEVVKENGYVIYKQI